MIILVVAFCCLVWSVGVLIQLTVMDRHWRENISEPWQASIESFNWVECDKYHRMAKYHLKHMFVYIMSPFHWFRVPKENE